MRYRYPTENSPFLDSGFRRNNGYAEVSSYKKPPSFDYQSVNRYGPAEMFQHGVPFRSEETHHLSFIIQINPVGGGLPG